MREQVQHIIQLRFMQGDTLQQVGYVSTFDYMCREDGCKRPEMRCESVMMDAMMGAMKGDGGRTQRAGGVDHLAKVQHKRAQTDTLIFRTPSPITTSKMIPPSYNMFYSTISGKLKPLWRSTFDIPMYGELFCDLDYFVMGYSFSELMGYDSYKE